MIKTGRQILRFILVFVVIASVLNFGVAAKSKKPNHTESFYVNDFSDCITASDNYEMCNKGRALDEKTKAQIVLVTIDSTDGEGMADYALELGRSWGVGDKKKNNGIVILLATEDRNIYVAVGYGLEGALNDSKVGRMIDTYAIPDLKKNDFSSACLKLYNALCNETYLEYGLEAEEGYVPAKDLKRPDSFDGDSGKVAVSWLIMAVIIVIYFFLFRGRGFFFWPFIGGGRGGFGGFGGGSSGGFGGFSGGGGSFGGGGAGRGF